MNRCGCDSWFKSFQTGELKKIEITRTESKLYCKLNLKHKMKVNLDINTVGFPFFYNNNIQPIFGKALNPMTIYNTQPLTWPGHPQSQFLQCLEKWVGCDRQQENSDNNL